MTFISHQIRRAATTAIVLSLFSVTTLFPSNAAHAIDEFGNGQFGWMISPQDCQARYADQAKFLYRSTYSQIINRRDRPLQIVCPVLRTDFSSTADCSRYYAYAYFRTNPSISRDPFKIRVSLASILSIENPVVYRADQTIPFTEMTWDNVSTYTRYEGTDVLSISCTQQDASGNTIDINQNAWPMSIWIVMPAGAQLRGIFAGHD